MDGWHPGDWLPRVQACLGASFLARVSQAEERDSARGVMKSPRGVPSPGASPGSNKRPPRSSLADLP